MGAWVRNRRQVKATIQTQRAVLCLQRVTQTDTTHKEGQDWCEEQLGTPCSSIIALMQDREMHHYGFTALIKSRVCKTDLAIYNSLVFGASGSYSSIMDRQKMDFRQFLCVNGQFSKIQSHTVRAELHLLTWCSRF